VTDMSGTPEDRPRPTPRPRPGTAGRPTPRPRVAGSRRDRDDAEPVPRTVPTPRPCPGARPGRPVASAAGSGGEVTSGPAGKKPAGGSSARPATTPAARRSSRAAVVEQAPARRRGRGLALTLAVLCLVVAGGGGFLLWQRLHPPYVTASVFSATRAAVRALYAFDYNDSDGSVQRKLAVLTGDLHDQYAKDLSQGGIIDTYEQVSATTSYEVSDVGLQQINDAQDTATLVVFGRYVVKSVNSGDQAPPKGSECEVTPDGAQACTQTVQVHVVRVDGSWKVSELTLLTTS
jgi:hypothetical protein